MVVEGYSYTSTPPMGRMACTEPQCLYKGALYLLAYCPGKLCIIQNIVMRYKWGILGALTISTKLNCHHNLLAGSSFVNEYDKQAHQSYSEKHFLFDSEISRKCVAPIFD
jgi:hypothetical protein